MNRALSSLELGSSPADAARPMRVPSPEPRVATWVAVLLVCAGYYAGGVLGLMARFPSSGISTIWCATPVLLVAFLLASPRKWWVYVVALLPVHLHLVANFQGPVPWPVMLSQFAGNVVHALLTALALRALLGAAAGRLDDFKGMVTFVLVAGLVVPWLVSASVVYFFQRLGWVDDYWLTWRARSLSNGVGALTVAPLVLWTVGAWRGTNPMPSARKLLEFALLTVGLVAVGVPVFREGLPGLDANPVWLCIPMPFLLWVAARFHPAALCLSLLVVAILTLSNTISGRGPFRAESPVQATVSLQLFLLTSAVPLLLLSAVMGERRRAAAALRASEVRYREMVESQTELVCRYLPDSTLTFVNEAYCRYFGRTREDLVGRSFLELIPEAGREAALAHVRALALHPEAKLLEHEVVRPDGSRGWNEWVDRAIFDRDGVLVEFQAIGRDISQRKQAEAALHQSTERIRELASRLIGAQESERTRIAMELHDGVSQRLAALSLGLSALKRHLGPEGLEQFGRLQSSAHALANEIRSLSHELHPGALRHAGLLAAIRSTCRDLDGKNGVSITLAGGEDLPALPANVSLCLYRVAQEALHNVVHHAKARHVSVILARDNGNLRMSVCDDGCGFDQADARASDGVGLISIEERVRMMRGKVEIDSNPRTGTEVRVEIPLNGART